MVFVVLGNYLNDDGTPSEILIKRLTLTYSAYQKFNPTKIIVSGGIANEKAGVSEAHVMKEYLVNQGISSDLIIEEGASMSTRENAINSMKIIDEMDENEIMIISSVEHFVKYNYNVLKYFTDVTDKSYLFMIYTK